MRKVSVRAQYFEVVFRQKPARIEEGQGDDEIKSRATYVNLTKKEQKKTRWSEGGRCGPTAK
ncbi:MAG: hypothetical protein IJZ04_03965 [Clostridia bacterium]|nr:hypothetical protein [Clostridia bacterium]